MNALFCVEKYIILSQNSDACSILVIFNDSFSFFNCCSYSFPIFVSFTFPRSPGN